MNNSKKIVLFSTLAVAALSFFVYQKVVAAPALKEGTYLSGQTLSVWPSWSLLGNTLGRSLPTDPINQLGLAGTCAASTSIFCLNNTQCPNNQACVLHDPNTGWSTADRRFSFACNRESYAYRYIAGAAAGDYTVRANFEDPGFTPANFSNFVAGFVSTSIIKINETSGVCNFDQEISTLQSGVCGDGRLNLDRGEQCDPPGRIEYANGCTTGVPSLKNLTVCNSSCLWTASTTLCSNFRKCGNGTKETPETCDDGALNGRYNHCNTTCNGFSPLGGCGNGILESAYEVCDPGTGRERYGTTGRNSSCSWDCQNWGPYCGNSVVESQYNEECDGSQSCSIGTNSGQRVCSSACKMSPVPGLVAWWSFFGGNFADSSGNNNTGSCAPASSCPTNFQSLADGKRVMLFDGNDYFTVGGSASINLNSRVTLEAWINPTNYTVARQRVVEKGAAAYGYWYNLEVNAAASGTARFNFSYISDFSLDSRSVIPTNTWTHLVGSFERVGQTNFLKIYVNGVLDNSREWGYPTDYSAVGAAPLTVGASRDGGGNMSNFFSGSIDDVRVYNRALSAAEIMSDYQNGWPCSATSTPVVSTQPGVCGNAVVDANEACDRGSQDNGRVCTPGYGTSCTYCSTDCQNTIDVQPSQYCGNGIIESTEKCDQANGVIYSAATNVNNTTLPTRDPARNGYQELACSAETSPVHTLKKGTKDCGNCTLGVVRSCVQCGVQSDGVGVSGGLINVLQGRTNPDPLFSRDFQNFTVTGGGWLDLSIGPCYSYGIQAINPQNVCNRTGSAIDPSNPVGGRIKKDNTSTDLVSYVLGNPYGAGNALVNSDPICSATDPTDRKYWMYINKDWTHPVSFAVFTQPQTWQYDIVLSPIVLQSFPIENSAPIRRNQDVRVVVSWVGPGEFSGGIINPFVTPQEINGASYCSFAYCFGGQRSYATGINYFNVPNSNLYGAWYHGFNTTPGQTNAESFTINTADMSGNTYSFFVKSPSVPIRQFRNTARLKVDVYLPEVGRYVYDVICCEPTYTNWNRLIFGTPVKTYYLLGAAPSDNQNAKYWQVFNINRPTATTTVSSTHIIDVSTIVTGPANFIYAGPLVARPACTLADWQSTVTYSTGGPLAVICYAPDTYTTTWSKRSTSDCAGGVPQPATVTTTCPPLPVIAPVAPPPPVPAPIIRPPLVSPPIINPPGGGMFSL